MLELNVAECQCDVDVDDRVERGSAAGAMDGDDAGLLSGRLPLR